MSEKPPFDPSKPFEEVAAQKPAFDPSKPFEAASSEPEKSAQPGKAMSAVSGLGQGATLGFGDELAGGVGAAIETIMSDEKRPFIERYREARDYARNLNAKAKEANPWTYGLSEVAGGVTSAAPLGGAVNSVKGATALGGTLGFGSSNADLTKGEFGEAAADTALGAGIGAGSALAAKALPAIGRKFTSAAEGRAVKAANLPSKVLDPISQSQGPTGVKSLGRDLLDEGIVSWRNKPELLQSRNNALLKSSGSKIDDILSVADDAGAKFDVEGVQSSLIDKYGQHADVAKDLDTLLKTVSSKGEQSAIPSEGRRLRQLIDERINYNSLVDPKAKGSMIKDAGRLIREKLSGAVDEAGAAVGNENLLGDFAQANRQYSLGKKLQTPFAKQVSNQFKPTGGGAPAKDWTNLVPGYKAAASLVGQTATNPKLLDTIGKVLQGNPSQLGRFAPELQKAAQRGPAALAATNHVLQQTQKEYRDITRSLSGMELASNEQ